MASVDMQCEHELSHLHSSDKDVMSGHLNLSSFACTLWALNSSNQGLILMAAGINTLEQMEGL